MSTSTVYLCTTDESGAQTYTEHQVWDRVLFVTTRQQSALAANGTVAMITRDEYLEQRPETNRRAS